MPLSPVFRAIISAACLLITFLLMASTAAAATEYPSAPFTSPDGSSITMATYYRYEALPLKSTDSPEVLGNYWHLYIKLPRDKDAVIRQYRDLVKQRGGSIIHEGGSTGFQFTIPDAGGNIYGILHCATQVKHTLKLVRETPCPGEVTFGQGTFLLDASSTTPDHAIITDMKGTSLRKTDYNDFNKLTLKYRENRKSVSKEVSGKYWHRYVTIIDTDERPSAHVSAREIRDSFLNAVIKAKAENLPRSDRGVSFRIDNPDGGVTWCDIWPQDGKYTMKIIDEAPMEQVLVFDSNEMMAQLDALGKITLEGIFFDTARSTLKKESDTSLQAALELLTDFPNLVLEVGGHTDSVGSAEANRTLSDGRANSVRQWLINNGIGKNRLQAKGYGEAHPVASNDTDAGRATNRRVELSKVSGGQVRSVISLIKPYPGSVLQTERDPIADGVIDVKMVGSNGKIKQKTITGTLVRKYYSVENEAGQRNQNISGIQILQNYAVAVKKFGGTILLEETHGLWFRLDNLDGSATYAHVHAPGPLYNIETINTVNP